MREQAWNLFMENNEKNDQSINIQKAPHPKGLYWPDPRTYYALMRAIAYAAFEVQPNGEFHLL